MTLVTYNLSPKLQQNIEKIDILKTHILTYPLNPQRKTRLVWEYDLEKVYWSLVLSGNQVGKEKMANIIFSNKKRLTEAENEIVGYNKALNYIYQVWTASSKHVDISTLKKLYDIAIKPSHRNYGDGLKKTSSSLENILLYLSSEKENPIIQAGIVHIHILGLAPFETGNGRIARLATYLFLYKGGYLIDRLFCLDEFLRKDLVSMKKAVDSVQETKNLTLWLEYFTDGIVAQLKKSFREISEEKQITNLGSKFWDINERQKYVLEIAKDPGRKVSNKDIQEKFKVSQITASRDLAKLVNLNLLFRHGSGRSTHYTGAVI